MPLYVITYFPNYGYTKDFLTDGVDTIDSIIIDTASKEDAIRKFIELANTDIENRSSIRSFLIKLIIDNRSRERRRDPPEYTNLVSEMELQFRDEEDEEDELIFFCDIKDDDITDYIYRNENNYRILLQMELDGDMPLFKITPVTIHNTFHLTKSARLR